MNHNEEQQWEDRFRKLGNIEPAPARPYFYNRLETRLKARGEQPAMAAMLPWWLQRPAYAFGTLGVLIALNVVVALWQTTPPTPETNPDTYETFVQDYQLDHQTDYADE